MEFEDHAGPTGRTTHVNLPASAATAFELLSRRWVLPLLYLLCQSDARFGELAHAMPTMSRKVLMERLRALEREGLVHRAVDPGPPTRITYQITELGSRLRPTLENADAWGDEYLTASTTP
jgi:DNA-binding HxlR family transcriptional regulator